MISKFRSVIMRLDWNKKAVRVDSSKSVKRGRLILVFRRGTDFTVR
jgi:hypothetical protein